MSCDFSPTTRRSWLAGLGLACLGRPDADPAPASDAEIEAIRERARKVGLGPFKELRSARFRVLGDAPEKFLRLTLNDAETLYLDYFDHFKAKGFSVVAPAEPLVAVVLADVVAFSKFRGERPNLAHGGVYERDSNRLVVYDYRPDAPFITYQAGRANLMTLAHEATHQLTFNTGLLNRKGDVPRVVAEGLAMYAERRSFEGRSPFGRVNLFRLDDLANMRRRLDWIPARVLLENDDVLSGKRGGEMLLLGYAQSWLLIYALLSDPARLPGFVAYLKTLRSRTVADSKRRVEDAVANWGDLDALDHSLKQLAVRLLKSR